jgi:hypothetical protein
VIVHSSRRMEPCDEPCPHCQKKGNIRKLITGTMVIDHVKISGRKLMDTGVRDRLDKMGTLYPEMKRTIGV